MEEVDYLRILTQAPDNYRVRSEYYEWLARNHHSRSDFVRLVTERMATEQKLVALKQEIETHPVRADQEWLDTVFPLSVRASSPGRFYSKPQPNASPYVTVGTFVQPETVVCLIEAHSLFTEIPAGTFGKITGCLVEDGAEVEWQQLLFKLAWLPCPTQMNWDSWLELW